MITEKDSKSKDKEIQDKQFQILMDDQLQYHSGSPQRKSQNFQILQVQSEQQSKMDENKTTQKRTNKSIMVSMIQDEDMINDYFINNQKGQNSKEDHTLNERKFSQFSQRYMKNNIVQQTNLRNNQTNKDIQAIDSNKKSSQSSNKSTAISTQKNQNIITTEVVRSPNQYHPTSRLILQKQKYNLQFQQVYGQIFIYIADSKLIGNKKQQYGLFLLTNYRIIFFKDLPDDNTTQKRVDLPFGFVKAIQYNIKRKQIIFNLNYSHFWKFSFEQKEDFDKIKIMLELYAKIKDIKSSFAFSYALRSPQFKKLHYQILKQYVRMHLSEISLVFPNDGFRLSYTYPPYICLPQGISQGSKQIIKSICQNFKLNRLPVMTFRYGNKQWAALWISGTYVEDHKVINQKQLKTYFSFMRKHNYVNKFHVYDIYTKPSKGPVQSTFGNKIQNHYLNLAQNSQIKCSYNLIVQAYLTPSLSFFSSVIQSRWYEHILSLLKSCFQMSQKLIFQQSVLLKQDQMRQKSLMLSALIQIILEPYYRSFKGFRNLVMKEFVGFGFRFSSRLGNRQAEDQCPTFILFLDAVHQLIHLNTLSFQFNSKYLSKLSNLMYTNIFGTFLADSPKEFFQSNLLEQTVQIWTELQNELTKNAFYEIKTGILTNKPHCISDLRFWLQHFSYLTGQPKDIYKMHPLAQTSTDYISLQCLKLKTQSTKLKTQLQKQKQQILKLRTQISERKQNK